MRKVFFTILLICGVAQAQHTETDNIEVSVFRGNIYKHTDYVGHLMAGHPTGFLVSWNKQTYGDKEWERAFRYPDYGFSFQYQDFANPVLGKAYAIGAHYNFYFFKRHMQFRISQGIGMTTNPYEKVSNYKNNAFGSRFMSSNTFMLGYKKDNLIDKFGIQAGAIFQHFSNGRIKSPNSGINSYLFYAGVNYTIQEKPQYKVDSIVPTRFTEPIKFNGVFRTGVSESQITGSGQKPFYHIGLYADKRLGRKSAIQLGTDVFISQYLKEYIRYKSIAYPEENVDADTDYKRVAVVVGHELFINKLSVETQLGYYVYKPFRYESDIYQRLGAKYYVTDKIFGALSLKAHGGRAEAIEVGIGIRL